MNFFHLFLWFWKTLKIFENERNVPIFWNVFVIEKCHTTHKNLAGDWTNSCMIIASIIFQKR